MSAGLGLFVLILLILTNAAINAVEIGVIAANRVRVRHLAETGSRRAQSLQRIYQKQDNFLAAIVFLVNLTVAAAGLVGAHLNEQLFGSSGFLQAVTSLVVVGYLTATIGDLTPKVVGVRASTGLALLVAPFAEAVTRLLLPFELAMGPLPSFVSKLLFGVDLQATPSISEAELRMQIRLGAQTGSVAEEEAELLDRVFHFGDRRVHEVMVPRTEVVWLLSGTKVSDFYKVFADHSHSRFPLIDRDPDHVLGVVGIKDVLRQVALGHMTVDSPIDNVTRPASFVPETKLVGELFREMQASHSQMAIAVDEYGGTAGIVTLEQLLEEMVGNVGDELHPPEPEIVPIDEQTVEVEGTLSIEEAREELGLDIPDGEYDTIAGYVLSVLGRFPIEGESISLDGYRVTVTEMKGPKIETLRVTKA
jgi:putative hemolysin